MELVRSGINHDSSHPLGINEVVALMNGATAPFLRHPAAGAEFSSFEGNDGRSFATMGVALSLIDDVIVPL